MGTAIIAIRSNAVWGLGHIGVAFRNDDSTWTAGSVEGKHYVSNINPGDENGGWVEKFTTLRAVEEKFHKLKYDKLKFISVANPDPAKAEKAISDFCERGFNFLINNCLHAVDEVVKAYGVKGLPRTFLVSPISYFATISGAEFTWNLTLNSYLETKITSDDNVI